MIVPEVRYSPVPVVRELALSVKDEEVVLPVVLAELDTRLPVPLIEKSAEFVVDAIVNSGSVPAC